MRFILHRDGTISVYSYGSRTKKHSMLIFDSELVEAGPRKKSIENFMKRQGWQQESDRYSVYWKHPQFSR
jgi:hypothetical protein